MNKIKLILALLLAPFFSQANIFSDGTVLLQPSINVLYSVIDCRLGYAATSTMIQVQGNIGYEEAHEVCAGSSEVIEKFLVQYENVYPTPAGENCNYSMAGVTIDGANSSASVIRDCIYPSNDRGGTYNFGVFNIEETIVAHCPPDEYPNYTYYVDKDKDGDVDNCADPEQIDLVDDCNYSAMHNSMSDYLINTEVTEQSICAEMPNGSICRYEAVDVGIGSQVYQYALEGDSCYNNGLPDITEIPNVALPTYNESMGDFQCIEDGGLLACSETPENVVDQNGNAPDGCGNIGGVYGCYSTDTDGDTLPDYLDPDIDGDGIRNEDDLDADGDGVDDVNRNNTGSGDSGSGSGGSTINVELDLEPVVTELKKLNETNVEIKTEPNLEQESFWESDYENGFQGMFEEKTQEIKSTALFSFIDKFQPNISGGSPANYNFCFNLGAMGNFGCHQLGIDARVIPAIKILILISAAFACRRIIFGG